MKINGITISQDNSKLGVIPSVSLPAGVTCRKNAPCFGKGCYACKGNFNYATIKEAYTENYAIYQQNARAYFDTIVDFLSGGIVIYKYFRWHSAGDIPCADYLRGMVNVARRCPVTKFLAFTKQFEIVNEYLSQGGEIPSNLRIVFSAWDKSFVFDNPYNLPVAYIEFCKARAEDTPNIPKTAMPCGGNCSTCLGCWSLRDGGAVKFKQH